MTLPTIAVLDYGNASFDSVVKSLQSTGARVDSTANFSSALSADGLLIAGLPDFAQTMLQLKTVRAAELIDARLIAGKSVLATGVAFQVLFEKFSENNTDTLGLSQWPGVVETISKKETSNNSFFKLDVAAGSKLLAGVENERFYFECNEGVLKWILDSNGPLHAPLVTWAKADLPFVAVVENGPLAGTQFQPETSADAGIKVLANWINSLSKP